MIDQYFASIESIIKTCTLITSKTLTVSKYTETMGYIKGALIFLDGVELHFREYMDVESKPSKLDYSYHCMREDNLLFRYDNTPHYPALSTFPHHKHSGPDEKKVSPCNEPTIESVIDEVLSLLMNTG